MGVVCIRHAAWHGKLFLGFVIFLKKLIDGPHVMFYIVTCRADDSFSSLVGGLWLRFWNGYQTENGSWFPNSDEN